MEISEKSVVILYVRVCVTRKKKPACYKAFTDVGEKMVDLERVFKKHVIIVKKSLFASRQQVIASRRAYHSTDITFVGATRKKEFLNPKCI